MNDNDQMPAKTPPDGPPVSLDKVDFHPEFGDRESMWNMKQWLQKAIEAQGATQTGGGMGMGVADIDFTLEGHKFNVQIRPQ